MAIVELYTSREMHITKEGTTLTRYFSISDDDWNAWTDGTTTLPEIGEIFSENRPDLRVTDIRNRWRSNKECEVEFTYSKMGMNFREKETDKIASMRDTFDFSVQAVSGMKFHDTDANAKEWPVLYGSEDAPDLIWYRPNITYSTKSYLSNWDWNKVKDSIGKVNSGDFMKQYYRRTEESIIDITGNDTGKWLFTGFNATQLSQGAYEIVMQFLYNDEGWNTPHGVSSSIKMYGTANFDRLPWPDDYDTDIDDGLR
ncbi:hypothetical protein LCGC14_0421550 [marine sediment metagenome]|uniref:Uncharacterized protein n=1 Tax=marine sediment metagenome TaxID=412755 RepID=A0A0F9W058_9ZZZZ